MQRRKRSPLAAAFDPQLLKLASLGYALPVVAGVASAVGVAALAPVWPLLFGPAVGLHALLALNVASRINEEPKKLPSAAREPSDDLEQSRKDLEMGFTKVKSDEGLKAVRDLAEEYQQLQPVLTRRRTTDSFAVGQIPALADETYRQGISVLLDALDLLQAASPEEQARLHAENDALEAEIAAMENDPSLAGRLRIRKERLASNEELIQIMLKQQERVDELLFQADRCGASLQRTRMELAGMRAQGSEEGVNAVVDTLRLTINHAKGVQDEMKRLGARSPGVS